jgi:UDP-glucose 4-epimerase
MFKDKVLLITGGTGSFGGAVLDKFLNTDIGEIRIFSRDEKKQDDLRHSYNSNKLKFYLGDVRDIRSIEHAINGVDFIFHAAALKQVPSCEFFPMEAVKTNVYGTANLLTAAMNNNVKKVITLSTDKAVYPINAMGMSKALMEKTTVAFSREVNPEKTVFASTRYGNVMGSRGSVIPLFIDQIKCGRDLTITDPNMTRFMMTLEEAVELVLFAFSNCESGDIYVQKSPAATVAILAEALIDLYNSKSKIKIIGTRHGEKLYETLVNREEMAKTINYDKYFRIPADNRDLNYERYLSNGLLDINDIDDYHSHNTHQLNVEEMKTLLLKLDFVKRDLDIKQ